MATLLPGCCQLQVIQCVQRGHCCAGTYCISCWVLHSGGPGDPLSCQLMSLAAFPRIPLGMGVKFSIRACGQASCMQCVLSCCTVTGLEAKRADSASLPYTSLLVCGTRLGAPFLTPDLSTSLQPCPDTHPPLGQHVQQCYLYASSLGRSYWEQ